MLSPSETRVFAFLRTSLSLWASAGTNLSSGGFFETLSPEGSPIPGIRRTLTQARQSYSFRIAGKLGVIEPELSQKLVSHGTRYLLGRCRQNMGGFHFSTTQEGDVASSALELYTQAFALFGLAQAIFSEPRLLPTVKPAALQLLAYLQKHRLTPSGLGYTETKAGPSPYASNPHMHLFEAALAWIEADPTELRWRALADELADLALNRFIDPKTGFLTEFFDEAWSPKRDSQGRFFFEPGHQYEWSWLLGGYARVQSLDSSARSRINAVRVRLFENAERYGLHPERHSPIDEVWSDGSPKTLSSRFWPHGERLKAAAALRAEIPAARRIAEAALEDLFGYLDVPQQGLWLDQRDPSGALVTGNSKASSLYHIIGAMAEYAWVPKNDDEK